MLRTHYGPDESVMLFSAYLGAGAGLPAWLDTVDEHAAWLGVVANHHSWRIRDNRVFLASWLTPRAAAVPPVLREGGGDLVVIDSAAAVERGGAGQAWWRTAAHSDENRIKVGVSLSSAELTALVPPTSPDHLCWTQDTLGVALANDERLLIRWAGLVLDEHALYGLFQFGAIPPPYTMSKVVKRVPGGHLLTVTPGSEGGVVRGYYELAEEHAANAPADPEARVVTHLRSRLAGVPRGSVLFFSGGVDSGLMAAVLARLGRMDVRLVNYAFGPEDQEAAHAARMADHLGLQCHKVSFDPSEIPTVLERLGRDYSFPFGDCSVIPTNLLLHASLSLVKQSLTAIDGTGAEGTFGVHALTKRWQRTVAMTHALPAAVRSLVSTAYRRLGLWRSESRSARLSGLVHGSVTMPYQQALMCAQNSLHGIAYSFPHPVRERVNDAVLAQTGFTDAEMTFTDRCALLFLMHFAAGRVAAKGHNPLRTRGVEVVQPFLEPALVRLSLSLPWRVKFTGGEVKGLLKRILARSVPPEWVYRPKSGFVPPVRRILGLPAAQDFLMDVVMAPTNPLLEMCHTPVLKEMIDGYGRGELVSGQAGDLLWTLMFASAWLCQQSRHPRAASGHLARAERESGRVHEH